MPRVRLAVATARFSRDLRDVVRLASETGASGLQFDARQQLKPTDLSETGRRQLLHTLGERELTVASLTFPLRKPLYDQEQLDLRIAAIKQAMQFAWDLKSRVLTCRIGRIPDANDSRDVSRLHEVLSDLAAYGDRVGVTFSIMPAGDPPGEISSLIHQIRTGRLGIDFDPAERIMSRHNPLSSLRELHEVVSHVTVRDALRDADGAGREVIVGRGESDWPALLAALDEMNFTGWMTVDRTTGSDPSGDAARAVQYVKNVAGP
ncbi:MAG: sugar phosphate isomerase/epimerase [Planctomycetaceae bacterium]|nr:sugar phosphate isomerase/epimerase [Planctomycetaceae bacterium]